MSLGATQTLGPQKIFYYLKPKITPFDPGNKQESAEWQVKEIKGHIHFMGAETEEIIFKDLVCLLFSLL